MVQVPAPTSESGSAKLGTAIFLIEALLHEIGKPNSMREIREAAAAKRARAFVQLEASR